VGRNLNCVGITDGQLISATRPTNTQRNGDRRRIADRHRGGGMSAPDVKVMFGGAEVLNSKPAGALNMRVRFAPELNRAYFPLGRRSAEGRPGANLTLIFKAPAGFEFNTSAPPNITFTSGADISAASVAISNATTITVTLSVGGNGWH